MMNKKQEKLLREFVRKNFVPQILKEKREEQILREHMRKAYVFPILKQIEEENKVRAWAKSLIAEVRSNMVLETLFEAKDTTNPHPNTGINKLRDALRKAKPSIKTKYQQLTTNPEQRETFSNHFLSAMVRLFDELDALNADGDIADEILSAPTDDFELESPPDDFENNIEKGLADLVEGVLQELEIDIENDEDPVDVVSDEFEDSQESTKEKKQSQVEKDVEKKKNQDKEREQFSNGLDGDKTGRNQAFDAFNLVQSYFSDSYLDLDNDEDKEMYKKWCLYNVKLLLDKYEEELIANPEPPQIEDPT